MGSVGLGRFLITIKASESASWACEIPLAGAPRSDDWGVWGNTPQGGASEGNAADDALMVDQGSQMYLTILPTAY